MAATERDILHLEMMATHADGIGLHSHAGLLRKVLVPYMEWLDEQVEARGKPSEAAAATGLVFGICVELLVSCVFSTDAADGIKATAREIERRALDTLAERHRREKMT